MILIIIYFPVTNRKDAQELRSKWSQKMTRNEIRKKSHC